MLLRRVVIRQIEALDANTTIIEPHSLTYHICCTVQMMHDRWSLLHQLVPQHSYTRGLGENLYELQNTPAWTAPGPDGGWHDALRAWYDDEAPQYDWSSASYWEGTGHFTQARATAALLACVPDVMEVTSHSKAKCHALLYVREATMSWLICLVYIYGASTFVV